MNEFHASININAFHQAFNIARKTTKMNPVVRIQSMPNHPSYSIMIMVAIKERYDPKGVSRATIANYITKNNYKGVRQSSRFLTTALQKAVKTCQIEEKSRGRYTIHVDQDKRET